MTLLQIFAAWLLADFIRGIVHWIEDRYLDEPSNRILADIARENDLHHTKPTAFLQNSGWTNMRQSAMVAWPLSLILFASGAPLVIWLAVFFAAFGNLIHRWSHMPARQLPRWIRGLQEFGVFASREHHAEHHRVMDQLIDKRQASEKYCIMTDMVNPLLDSWNFWSRLESLVAVFGIQPTVDPEEIGRGIQILAIFIICLCVGHVIVSFAIGFVSKGLLP